jgi:hypothetical protein
MPAFFYTLFLKSIKRLTDYTSQQQATNNEESSIIIVHRPCFLLLLPLLMFWPFAFFFSFPEVSVYLSPWRDKDF